MLLTIIFGLLASLFLIGFLVDKSNSVRPEKIPVRSYENLRIKR